MYIETSNVRLPSGHQIPVSTMQFSNMTDVICSMWDKDELFTRLLNQALRLEHAHIIRRVLIVSTDDKEFRQLNTRLTRLEA